MLKKVMSVMTAAMMLQGIASAGLADNLMCGNGWVAGEALLLRPTGGYPYSVTLGSAASSVPEGCQLANCPSYDWGYKIELGYRNCDKEVLINWLSFNNSYKSGFEFTDLQQVWESASSTGVGQAGPGRFSAINTVKYDVLDAEVAKRMCNECSKFSSRVFLGLRYARIQNNRASFLEDHFSTDLLIETVVASRSDVQGTGPRAGLGGRWDAWCGVGLTGSVAGHLLIGSAKSQFVNNLALVDEVSEEFFFFPAANVKNRKVCRIIPASEIKLGLDWEGCLFCGFSGMVGVGYQISHYFYGDQSTLFTQNNATAAGTNHVHTDPVSFDGWYFKLGLQY